MTYYEARWKPSAKEYGIILFLLEYSSIHDCILAVQESYTRQNQVKELGKYKSI